MKDDKLKLHVDSLLRSRARALNLSRRTERTRVPLTKDWQEFRPSADWRVAQNRELSDQLKVVARQFSEQAEL